MAERARQPGSPFWRFGLPLVVLGLSLGLSLWAGALARDSHRSEVNTYFQFRFRDALDRIEHRLKAYEQVLLGGRGLFAASQSVARGEFCAYVGALDLQRNYPGIQGVGYSLLVPRTQREAHEAAVRREGFPAYRIRPEGARDPYSSIIYLEPFRDRNLRAFGYDMYAEPVRRQAMARARDEGRMALSGKVTLVQETHGPVQAGFLMYVPVFRNGHPTDRVEDRRKAHLGWVYAPFRMADFLAGVLGERAADLDLEVRDLDGEQPDSLMFHAVHDLEPSPGSPTLRRAFEFGGHRWTISARAFPSLKERLSRDRSGVVVGLGVGIGVLLTALTWALAEGRARALAIMAEQERSLVQQNRLAAMGEMVGNIAHQWRQPLNALSLVLSNLRDAQELGELDAGRLDTLMEDGHRLLRKMSTTINDFRNFFREDKEKVAFSLLTQVRETVVLMEASLKNHGITLQVEAEQDPKGFGYPNEFSQVLLNLLSNAKEAILGSGRTSGSIWIRLDKADGLGRVRVLDNGGGVPAALLPRIFEARFTTKAGGTGVGLYLSRVIIERNMGGRLEAANAAEGMEFTVCVPLAGASR